MSRKAVAVLAHTRFRGRWQCFLHPRFRPRRLLPLCSPPLPAPTRLFGRRPRRRLLGLQLKPATAAVSLAPAHRQAGGTTGVDIRDMGDYMYDCSLRSRLLKKHQAVRLS